MAVDGTDSGSTKRRENEASLAGAVQDDNVAVDPLAQLKADARKARVNAAWEQLNSNGSTKAPNIAPRTSKAAWDKTKPQKSVPEWMVSLGLAPKKTSLLNLNSCNTEGLRDGVASKRQREAGTKQNDDASEEAKRIAAAALTAVKEAGVASRGGKIEVNEVREFAGEEVKLKKFVDPNSRDAQDALEKAKMQASSSSGLDALLEQIRKKPKLNILDKSRKDWGDFKEEKGLEEELDAYKKSGDKYLDKVYFLQRADLREFERERDARLAQQAKRRTDTQRDSIRD
eukprot:Gb_16949 [translate_table: standard]